MGCVCGRQGLGLCEIHSSFSQRGSLGPQQEAWARQSLGAYPYPSLSLSPSTKAGDDTDQGRAEFRAGCSGKLLWKGRLPGVEGLLALIDSEGTTNQDLNQSWWWLSSPAGSGQGLMTIASGLWTQFFGPHTNGLGTGGLF